MTFWQSLSCGPTDVNLRLACGRRLGLERDCRLGPRKFPGLSDIFWLECSTGQSSKLENERSLTHRVRPLPNAPIAPRIVSLHAGDVVPDPGTRSSRTPLSVRTCRLRATFASPRDQGSAGSNRGDADERRILLEPLQAQVKGVRRERNQLRCLCWRAFCQVGANRGGL